MEKKIEVKGKSYIVKELKYKDVAELADLPKGEIAKKQMILCTGMSEEEYNELSMSEGIEVQKVINEVNNLGNLTPLNA
jgi:hypothetical protein